MILACLTVMAGFTFTVIATRRARAGVYYRYPNSWRLL